MEKCVEEEIPEWLEINENTWFFTKENFIKLYFDFVEKEREAGRETENAGILNMNLLESTLDKMKYGDYFPPQSLLDSVAFLIEGVVAYHVFSNVNKRFSAFATIIFLDNNGINIKMDTCIQLELVPLLIETAEGRVTRDMIVSFYEPLVYRKKR